MTVINELKAMAIFAEVVKQGSFSKAAKSLSLSPSVISYHISQLEEKVGAALIYRSTRRLTLSHDGEQFYTYVQKMLVEAHNGIDLLSKNHIEPQGKIRLSLPTALSRSVINEKIAQFCLQFPKVQLEIEYSDSHTNIIKQGIDLTIRASLLEDSELMSKRIGSLERILVCSHSFFNHFPQPQSLTDIENLPWIKLKQLGNERLFLQQEQHQTITLTPRVEVNSVEAIYHYCLQGIGLAVLARSQVSDDIENERLVHVLPNWQVAPLPLYALWPKNIPKQSPVKRLLTFLQT